MNDAALTAQSLVEGLERLWQAGQQPDPLAYLQAAGPCAPALVAAVLAVDQWQRWHGGQPVAAEEYLRRCPVVAEHADAAVEVIYGEFLVRHALGEQPTQGEYLERFPQFAAGLRVHFGLFEALQTVRSVPALPQADPLATQLTMASSPLSPVALPDGPKVPGYEILGLLGRGGVGVVYKARHLKLNRIVALKMILAGGHSEQEHLVRFLAEAEAIAQLHHPHIVQLFETGQHQGVPFLTLECVEGGTLESHGRGAPLPAGAAARLVEQLARGIAYAHSRGIVHRDLKPANVLLAADGTPKITDFGLAKRVEVGIGLTQTGAILGTPSYMAPEQARGQGKHVGAAADVYALGAILYRLITGRPPFQAGSVMATMLQVLENDPVSLTRLQPATPPDLDTICLKCLQKEPGQRYATALELAEDLQRFQAGEPIRARPVGRLERLVKWARRRPVVAGLIAAVALLLVTIAVGSTVAALSLRSALTRTEAAERAARLREAEALAEQAHGLRLSRRGGRRFEALAALRKAAAIGRELGQPPGWFDRLRNEAASALALSDLSPRYLGEVPEGASVCDLSDDLSRVLLWEPKAKAHVVRSVGEGKELFRLPTTAPRLDAFFGPGRRHIVRHHADEGSPVEVWSLDGRQPRLIRSDRFPVWNFSSHFRPDGSILALAERHGAVAIWDLRKGTEINRLPPAGGEKDAIIALHPSEPLVGSCSYRTKGVLLRDYQTGRTVQVIRPVWSRPMGCFSLTWHPGGRRLFVAAGDTDEVQEYTFDPVRRQLSLARLLRTAGGHILAVNPAGDRLAGCGWGGAPILLDLETGLKLFHTHSMKTLDRFRFAADGRSVIGTHGFPRGRSSYGVFSVGDAREVRTIPLRKPGSVVGGAVVHSAGRLAVIPQGDRFTFVDLAALRELGAVKRGNRGRSPSPSTGRGICTRTVSRGASAGRCASTASASALALRSGYRSSQGADPSPSARTVERWPRRSTSATAWPPMPGAGCSPPTAPTILSTWRRA
jgi:tRNA A-37 threonylcarbamoyl transferase component Bud32